MSLGDDILRVSIESQPNVEIKLDRSRLYSHIKPAVKQLLLELHVHKSTAAAAAGTALYDRLSEVDKEMELVRNIIIGQNVPRKRFVQCNTFLINNQVVLKEYEPTVAGIIQSWAERDI